MEELTYTPMTMADLPDILKIEQASFPAPWSRTMFERDILYNKLAHIFSVRQAGEIIGYFSIWKIVDEGHLVTLAVEPARRRQGVGAAMLRETIRRAAELNISKITLEVRETNREAIRLYTQFGFIKAGVRLKYYEDAADAWIMDLDISHPDAMEASA